MDLLEPFRAQNALDPKQIFILVTADSNETSIAEAAEEDIDAYILKPFTSQKLEYYFAETILAKVSPDDYRKSIQSGKTHLSDGRYDEAIAEFTRAKTYSDRPSLAFYYTGQGFAGKQQLDNAIAQYRLGLEFNSIHYKCLVGLFDCLMAKRDTQGAYGVINQVTSVFPVSPQRLGTVLRLAVETQNYEDVDRYYRMFTELEHRSRELVRTVAAALTVSGLYLLQKSRVRDAVDMFSKASVSSGRNPKILREVITHLVKYKWYEEGESFMKLFPASAKDSADYKILDCLLADGLLSANFAIDRGRKLISENIHDPMVYKMLIRRYMGQGWPDSAEELCNDARVRWPHLNNDFAFESFIAAAALDAAEKAS